MEWGRSTKDSLYAHTYYLYVQFNGIFKNFNISTILDFSCPLIRVVPFYLGCDFPVPPRPCLLSILPSAMFPNTAKYAKVITKYCKIFFLLKMQFRCCCYWRQLTILAQTKLIFAYYNLIL